MSGAAQKYSSMTSKDLGSDWSKKVQMYIDAQAEVTGQQDRKKGFKNKAGTGTVPKAMKENYEADWPSMFAGLHGRPPANGAELDQWLDTEWEAYAAQKNPELAAAKLNAMPDDQILKTAGDVNALSADFHYWVLDRVAMINLGENDEAKPKWFEDAQWQYDLFEQYNGRSARDDEEVGDWLYAMLEVQKSEGVDYRSVSFRNWIENKIIMKRAMGESIASALLGESIVAWHASPNRFRTFDTSKEGAHFGSKEQAENLRKAGLRGAKPYRLELRNPLRVRDIGTWTVDGIATELHVADVISDEEADQIYAERNWSDERGYARIKEILAGKGYDGFVYENEQEGPGDSYVAFYSRQIKPLR